DYLDAELAAARARVRERAEKGDPHARGELTRIRVLQSQLERRRQAAFAVLKREPELVFPGEIEFVAHALVVPAQGAAERDDAGEEVERLAMEIAKAHEARERSTVQDVSTPEWARAAGLTERPGFDL